MSDSDFEEAIGTVTVTYLKSSSILTDPGATIEQSRYARKGLAVARKAMEGLSVTGGMSTDRKAKLKELETSIRGLERLQSAAEFKAAENSNVTQPTYTQHVSHH